MSKALKLTNKRRASKRERQKKVLFGLIEYFLKTGEQVGSTTLKDTGFQELSSATIRNYFAKLEEQGYLHQEHASAGRIPTEKAFRLYAEDVTESAFIEGWQEDQITRLKMLEGPEITRYLQRVAEVLSGMTHSAAFLIAPRFDQDFIIDVKLLELDTQRILAAIVTNFGVVRSELFHIEEKLSPTSLKRIEAYFQARVRAQPLPDTLSDAEEALAKGLYNELMVRYVVGYSNFSDEEVYRTGFSQLLHYKEFSDVAAFSAALSLFENVQATRHLLRETTKHNDLRFWVGEQLKAYAPKTTNCSVIAIPYRIHDKAVGAIGIMGPMRIPYRNLFGVLQVLSECISQTLTDNICRFKICYRQPERREVLIPERAPILIEDQGVVK